MMQKVTVAAQRVAFKYIIQMQCLRSSLRFHYLNEVERMWHDVYIHVYNVL